MQGNSHICRGQGVLRAERGRSRRHCKRPCNCTQGGAGRGGGAGASVRHGCTDELLAVVFIQRSMI
eukprot:365638-Chlamydomonas_euryale.AAC.8